MTPLTPHIPDDIAAELGRAVFKALTAATQPPSRIALPPCSTCEGTGWVDVDPYVDPHGHVYPQVEPCDCGRVRRAA